MEFIGVGLIGFGLAGSVFHAPLIASVPPLRLVAVATSRAGEVRARCPEAEVEERADRVIERDDVDVVVVANPHPLHFETARRALEAGKHVVVEKPFTMRAREADELIHLAEARGRLLTVFHNRRWDGDFLTVARLVRGGALGEVYTYEAHYDRYRLQAAERWQERAGSGGTLFNLGPHLVDQALQLFGRPKWVWADVGVQRGGGADGNGAAEGAPAGEFVGVSAGTSAGSEDYFHIVLGYGRLRVVLHSGYVVPDPGPRFLVHGHRGSFCKYGIDPQEDQLKVGVRPGAAEWGRDRPEMYGTLSVVREDGAVERRVIETERGCYERFYEGLADALLRGGSPPVDAREARDVIQVLEWAQESSRTGVRLVCAW
ncbi:MAG: Gfo/Idh/MocA family oxidoreductase [Alicyclobacillus macrosporangiidus]|uniref:Gfo/Idh/MocA family oxidoreductase n=1 Tax=Alicyclobacillus macrosporangiidus TaxID=392015 RepID=UPI0026EA0456|nr:Gfo/Idh/MocA family oxidoreductase [Alicyclobacillus macrosporangiidus]MCL6600295.1 Gfo/Idh/MocA family oxidoreductase [Alicyclobacillus macrosporangiidus]